jgi:hypothetical protein
MAAGLDATASIKPWRGFLATFSWFVWPPAFVIGSAIYSGDLASQCVADSPDCGPQGTWGDDALFLAGMFCVPVALTVAWIRWRMRRA